jgi:hypothetical protein
MWFGQPFHIGGFDSPFGTLTAEFRDYLLLPTSISLLGLVGLIFIHPPAL